MIQRKLVLLSLVSTTVKEGATAILVIQGTLLSGFVQFLKISFITMAEVCVCKSCLNSSAAKTGVQSAKLGEFLVYLMLNFRAAGTLKFLSL